MPYVLVSCQLSYRRQDLSEAVVKARLNNSSVHYKQRDLFIAPLPLRPARYCACERSDTSNRSGHHYLCAGTCFFLKTILSIAFKLRT